MSLFNFPSIFEIILAFEGGLISVLLMHYLVGKLPPPNRPSKDWRDAFDPLVNPSILRTDE